METWEWLSSPGSNRLPTSTILSQHFLPLLWRLTPTYLWHPLETVCWRLSPLLSFLCFTLCIWQSLLDADIALYATQGCFIIKNSYINIMVIIRKRMLEALKGTGWAAQWTWPRQGFPIRSSTGINWIRWQNFLSLLQDSPHLLFQSNLQSVGKPVSLWHVLFETKCKQALYKLLNSDNRQEKVQFKCTEFWYC